MNISMNTTFLRRFAELYEVKGWGKKVLLFFGTLKKCIKFGLKPSNKRFQVCFNSQKAEKRYRYESSHSSAGLKPNKFGGQKDLLLQGN
jgi:hypothetical protein